MPKPEICPQGEYDGACFLYSVTNAYKTLTGKHPTFNMWDNAVEHIPFRDDFIRNIGTYWYDDNMYLYEITIKRMLKHFARKKYSFKISSYEKVCKSNKLRELINHNSVIVLNISSEHWVTAIDIDEENIYFADSYKLAQMGSKYEEFKSANLGRIYNDYHELNDMSWLYNPSVIKITLL